MEKPSKSLTWMALFGCGGHRIWNDERLAGIAGLFVSVGYHIINSPRDHSSEFLF
jgi:hypothetical protein